MPKCVDLVRAPRQRIILASVLVALGLAQVITGGALGDDVYSWGICGFTLLTGCASMGFGGYSLYTRGEMDRELAFALCVSILLANLQAVFVIGACTAPLAEAYAIEILHVYEDVMDEMFSKECSTCLNTEDAIEAQVIEANSQNFGGEVAYVVLSVLQLIVLAVGCVVNFDNHALGELDMVPNSCLTLDNDHGSGGVGSTDELGFDEL